MTIELIIAVCMIVLLLAGWAQVNRARAYADMAKFYADLASHTSDSDD